MASVRPKKAQADPPAGNFDFLFLQLMLVMLAFFILLSSMATLAKHKTHQALGSVAGAFSILSTGNRTQGQTGSAGKTAARAAKNLTDVTKLLNMQGVLTKVTSSNGTVLIRLPGSLLFAPGQIRLNASMNPFLDILADLLRRNEVKSASINGYTDNTPISGRYKSNWELSAARAMQVFFALAKRGVPANRMVLAGMGSAHPLPADQTRGNPSLNRRVEIRITFNPVFESKTGSNTPATKAKPPLIKMPSIKPSPAPSAPASKQPS